ncbi:MAG: P-loop NTPase [Fusobacteriaceae bacterium]
MIEKINKRIKIISGHYGSGKTEFAVNFALKLSGEGKKVAIADLDIVNPYFRTRECEELFYKNKIEVLGYILKGDSSDLPAVSGNVSKPFYDKSIEEYIIDLGGDSSGSKAFASFRTNLNPDECDLFFLVNANRPETSNLVNTLNHLQTIEGTLNLRVTKLVNSTHLLWDTTEEDLFRGNNLTIEISEKLGLPIEYTICNEKLLASLSEDIKEKLAGELFPVKMIMRKKWM